MDEQNPHQPIAVELLEHVNNVCIYVSVWVRVIVRIRVRVAVRVRVGCDVHSFVLVAVGDSD